MKVLITGGAGFLGQRLAKSLLGRQEDVSLVLADRVTTDAFAGDRRVASVACDIADGAGLARVVTPGTDVIYHLAAVLSGQSEREFDLGLKINLDATRALLELCRRLPAPPRFIFTSSIAVFGGGLPAVVTDRTAAVPQSSYGTGKAAAELLVNDYSRRGFVDGRVLRLPTIAVRPGQPNSATSSFVSGIIREPLKGEPAVCPVGRDVAVWLSSPAAAVENLRHAHLVPAAALGQSRLINLPGLSVTVGEMIATLARVAGAEVAALIRFERDAFIEPIVTSWPGKFDTARAEALGFQRDPDFETVIRNYLRDDAPRK